MAISPSAFGVGNTDLVTQKNLTDYGKGKSKSRLDNGNANNANAKKKAASENKITGGPFHH
ncbi:hypothetical protein H4J58_18595 [Colwellia sp. MB3u-70]|uniref:hypothetical protein n=1 Tax=unclassified Colwellia TaxID=196834 RepID=UPI0015F4E187|nr:MULTISPECIES: hypothetical protein [unclassified Colwellia]MBA6292134.1 hypothetical protein [Colwellia sp. MB3u-8]MBA6309116.1 hypothetical protein [Colwellia sp. MB3u-70]